MTPLLDVSGLAKRFGGLHAVKDVSFEVRPGTVKVVVLRYGEKIADARPRAVRKDPEVVRVYLGEDGC